MFCSAKAAAHAAQHSASGRWSLSAKPTISDLRLPALQTENRLRSNPPQPLLFPQINNVLVLEKPRDGHRRKGLFSPAASAAETVPTPGYLGGAKATAANAGQGKQEEHRIHHVLLAIPYKTHSWTSGGPQPAWSL